MQRDGGPGGPGGPGAGGAGNPIGSFTGAAKALEFMGNGVWAGWSGRVNATTGSDASLFNFTSPGVGLKVIASFFFDENDLSANAKLGLTIKLNGIIIYNMRVKKSGDSGFTNLDSDQIGFVIPAFSVVLITTQTDDSDDIPTGVNLVCEEI